MFLHVSVILFTGGSAPGGGACSGGYLLPGGGSAPGRRIWSGGVPAPGGGLVPGGLVRGAWWRPPPTATAAGGRHPTGVHSC